MRRTITLMAVMLSCGIAMAQDWAKKESQAVFTLKTFGGDGSMIGSTTGFFIDSEGTAVSGFSPMKGATRAVVIDAAGKEMEVECILGANDTYDLAKFKVAAKKTVGLPISSSAPAEGDALWLMPYSAKRAPQCIGATVKSTQKVDKGHDYFTLATKGSEGLENSPVLNSAGQVVGIVQQGGSDADSTGYAASIGMATELKMTGLSINDPKLRLTNIKKALPDDVEQAILMLYVGASVVDSLAFESLVSDFIDKFPAAADGYVYKAQLRANAGRLADADSYMQQAVKMVEKKDDAHYNYSKIIYQKLVYQPEKEYAPWTFDKAIEEADEALKANPLAAYSQLKAEILFSAGRFSDALDVYQGMIDGGSPTADNYLSAARCKEEMGDTLGAIAMMDSAIATFSKPYLKEAAPYLLARAQAYLKAGKNRLAVVDLNEYEGIMSAQVNDNFYYIRAQAALAGHLYQQALDDLKMAISKAPDNLLYYSEKASLEVRVSLLDDAITTSREIIALDPELSDGYLFLGLAQCLKGEKAEGVANLSKAKELGEEQAEGLIEKYGK